MEYLAIFSLKNNEKVFMNTVCCSRDWRFKGYTNCSNVKSKKRVMSFTSHIQLYIWGEAHGGHIILSLSVKNLIPIKGPVRISQMIIRCKIIKTMKQTQKLQTGDMNETLPKEKKKKKKKK